MTNARVRLRRDGGNEDWGQFANAVIPPTARLLML